MSSETALQDKQRMFSSLASRDFRYLWSGNLAATFAMNMQMVARGWLIYDMTQSPIQLAWVMMSFSLPMILFSLFGGVAADSRKTSPPFPNQTRHGVGRRGP